MSRGVLSSVETWHSNSISNHSSEEDCLLIRLTLCRSHQKDAADGPVTCVGSVLLPPAPKDDCSLLQTFRGWEMVSHKELTKILANQNFIQPEFTFCDKALGSTFHPEDLISNTLSSFYLLYFKRPSAINH